MVKKPAALLVRVIALAVLPLMALTGCAVGAPAPNEPETVTQVSTIDALLEGVYDGVMTFETLRTHGDFGIGTFAALDGEMLAFDGRFFQVTGDGAVRRVSDDMETPFAAVTFFEEDFRYAVPGGLDLPGFEEFLDSRLETVNTFYAVRVDGTFAYVKTRSVPAQQKPYPPLAEVTANQMVFEFGETVGTVVGFRCPSFVGGVNVPGYHLHFISEDESSGGHLLAFTVSDATVTVDVTRDFSMILPEHDSDFYGVDLTPDKQETLEQVEK
jgi:acetolactate decarboxylase